MAAKKPIINSVVTLDAIKARCVPSGACWVWSGATIRNRPYMSEHKEGVRLNSRVQKLVLELSGEYVPEQSPIAQSCGNRLCCNPEHQEVQAAPGRMGFMRHAQGNPFGGLLWGAR